MRVRQEDVEGLVLESVYRTRYTVFIAPTGFGKSSLLYRNLGKLVEAGTRFLHMFPLRSVVEDQLDRLGKALEDGGLPKDFGGYTAGISSRVLDEDPYMLKPFLVATYDSSMITSLLLPLADLGKSRGHWDLSATALYRRLVVADELHVLLRADELASATGIGISDPASALAALIAIMSMHYSAKLLLASATLAPAVLRAMVDGLKEHIGLPEIIMILGRRGLNLYRDVIAMTSMKTFDVRSLEDSRIGTIIDVYRNAARTRVDERPVAEIVREVCSEGVYNRIAVFFNTVREAIESYSKIVDACSDYDVYIIHGRLGRKKRSEIFRSIRDGLSMGRRMVVVSTQVLEAGADISFDAIVTQIASPESLMQRFGRVLRSEEEAKRDGYDKGSIKLVVSISKDSIESSNAIYGEDSTNIALEFLRDDAKKCSDEGRLVDWRYGLDDACITAYDMLRKYGSISIDVSNCLSEAMDYISNQLSRVLIKVDPRVYLREADKVLRWCRLREGFLAPLVIISNDKIIDRLDVSSGFLSQHAREILGDNPRAIFIARDLGSGAEDIVEMNIPINMVRKFNEEPITMLYNLKMRALSEYGRSRDIYLVFEGFRIRDGVYDERLGLLI